MRRIGIEYPECGRMQFYELGEPGGVGATEVLLRTRYSGITNGTERHALMADFGWKQFPGRHGYQHVGIVEAVGSGAQRFRVGDRVFFGRYVGHRGWHIQDVAHADLRSIGSHLCLPLPGDVEHAECALLGVAGVAMRGARRFRVGAGQSVWVAGAGLIGQFAAQAARCLGARVTVTDVNARRLEIAATLGAYRVLNAADADHLAALREGGPYDVLIDASGATPVLASIVEPGLLAHGGVIGCLAVRSEVAVPWGLLHAREASVEVSCHFSLDDLRVVLHFLRLGALRIAPLITHRVPIDGAPAIYETLRERPEALLGVVFDWGE
jgi:3-hydroxyethyl bacteriochlorophyllide a dehydrogenase